MKRSFTVRQLALNAVLIAISTVLAGLAVNLGGNFKITFESLPVHIGALLFGPVDGMLIGGIATFIYQVLLKSQKNCALNRPGKLSLEQTLG